MPYLEVWTASHITEPRQWIILELTIQSVIRYEEVTCHRISLSSSLEDAEENATSLAQKYSDKVDLMFWVDHKKQFEHYQELLETSDASDDVRIMVMDDDDLLLSLPSEVSQKQVIRGYQYLPPDIDLENFCYDNILNEEKDSWEKVVDFSGYTCSKEQFGRFIEEFKQTESYQTYLSPLIDTKFMDFLDNEDNTTPLEPFIYHRCWRDSNEKPWKKSLSKTVDELFNRQREKIKDLLDTRYVIPENESQEWKDLFERLRKTFT